MNKSLIIHTSWAVIAIISFVVGAQRFTSSDEPTADDDSGDRRGARSSERSSESDTSSRRSRSASRNKQRDGSDNMGNSGSINLSEKGIKSLGHILQTSNDPIERRIAFSKLLEGLTADNAQVLREQIIHMSSESSEWKDFHYAWGALGGQSVVEFGKNSEKRDMAAAFSGWAGANPQAAIAWFNSQEPDHQNRKDLKWGAVYGLANADPQVATEFAMQRQELGDKDAVHMMNLIAKTVLRTGNPVEAARWSTSLPEGNLQDVAVSQVAQGYAKEDPTKAITWLESLPQSNGKSKGLGTAFSTWASRDAEAAGKRLNQMGDSPARDSAVTGYSRRIAYTDPRSAIDWASTITNPKVRTDTLVHSGRMYVRRDREAARQWLAGSNLSPTIQKRIIGASKRK
jgi:hypothetical protein